ncbi:MAG TPA: DNA polymerase III subunit gamma/tau [Pyrinomonadaceae bacterium]|jgi:DNA polymerase-3 subunit gamma/tau
MSYQVIARKWRPQTFEEVTGQEPITRTLRGAIEHDRLHHAYLFSGARGVGKTTTARLLAKALNCHKSDKPTPTPCKSTAPEACPSCREIAEGRSIDVLEIDAASNTGVDNVREAIINTVAVRPARDRFKVFIIDEVHMLSGAAFNALLKTLEEPPPRIVFIMATTEAHKVPDTILSRCQQFEFRTIAAQKIAERLRLIADAERVEIDDDALREIARAGDGSMRDAQSAFDQVISFSEGRITTADVEAALGLASAEQLARVVAAVADERPGEALAVVDDLVMRGHDLRNFCRDLLAHLRDLLVAKIGGGAEDGDETARRHAAAAAAFSESDLVRFFHSLTDTEQKLREGAHPRYQLEVGLVKLIEMRRLAPITQIIERLGALEEALRTGRTPLADATSGAPPGGAPPRTGGGRGTPSAPSRTSTPRAAEGDTSGAAAAHSSAAAPSSAFTSLSADAPSSASAPSSAGAASSAVSSAASPSSAASSLSAAAPPPSSQPAAPAPSRAASASPAAFVAKPASDQAPTRDPLDWSAHSAGGSTADAPFWETLAAPDATTAQTQNVASPQNDAPSQTAAASSSSAHASAPPSASAASPASGVSPRASGGSPGAPLRLVTKSGAPPAQTSQTGGKSSFASRGWRVPGRDDLPEEPPEFARRSGRGDALAEQVKRALEERRRPLLATALDGARKAELAGDEFYVEFAPERKHLRDSLNKPDAMKLLRDVCREVVGRDVGVRVVVREAGESDAPPTREDEELRARQELRQMAENHPAVQHLLRTFRAEIIDVRRVEPES